MDYNMAFALEEELSMLTELISNSTTLKYLHYHQKIQHYFIVFAALEDNCHIETLNLELDLLGDVTESKSLGRLLSVNHTLKHITIWVHNINEENIARIIAGLKDNSTLESFTVYCERTIKMDKEIIVDLFEHNFTLTKLRTNTLLDNQGNLINKYLNRNKSNSATRRFKTVKAIDNVVAVSDEC